MKITKLTAALVTTAAFTMGCSSVPTKTSLLDQSHIDYRMAQQSSNVSTYATVEMQQASDALNQADAAAQKQEDAETVNRLAYIAKQKIALAQEVGKKKADEASIPIQAKKRDQMRLDERSNQVDEAKRDAVNSQNQVSVLQQQLRDLAAKKTDRGMIITLSDVLFATDQSNLNADGIRTLQKLATILQQNPTRNVLIEGFTDSTGSVAHNQMLSERRARAVSSVLQMAGVGERRILVRGYGESFPAEPNDTALHRQLNRRVEILLSDDNGELLSRQ